MRPEIAIRPQQPSRHVHDDLLALLRADRLGAHLGVFVVLVAEHHHRDQASAVLLVVDKLRPAVVAHGRAPHESASPVVAVRRAVLVLQQERHVDLALEQRPGDGGGLFCSNSATTPAMVFQCRIMSPKISLALLRRAKSQVSDIPPPKTSG